MPPRLPTTKRAIRSRWHSSQHSNNGRQRWQQPQQQMRPPDHHHQQQNYQQQLQLQRIPQEDKWVVNKPAERRSKALNEELTDCFGRFMTWVTCGGPAARMRQLYINGHLSKCWDEYTRFKNCLIVKLNPDQEIQVLPGPHPLWHIRTRKQAAAFWQQHYQHMGAGATETDVPEAALKPDLASNT